MRLACARANAKVYGVEKNIEFIEGDFVDWARARAIDPESQEINVVFMSPPWGGIDYRVDNEASFPNRTPAGEYATYPLSKLAPRHGEELFELARVFTKNVAYYLPRNLDLEEAAALVPQDPAELDFERVEVEEEWMGSKLKALCLYYGGLADPAG